MKTPKKFTVQSFRTVKTWLWWIWGFLHYRDTKKFLKNLLLWNCWSDFEIISQECSFGDPFQKLFAKFWSVHKHGSGERGIFALYRHKENHKTSSCPKLHVWFWNNFTGMFLMWPFSDTCFRNFDPSVNMALVNGGFLHYTDMKKFIKNLPSQKPLVRFWNDFTGIRVWH